jgi:amino acid adenylation domain-containing protein
MKADVIHQLLSASAECHPDRIAVVDGARTMTYADLESSSNRLAGLLIELGVRRGDRVGLYLRKSAEALIGVYGILKAGAAYVPLDPQAPEARLGYIAANCDLRCLLSGAEQAEAWAGLVEAGAPLETVVVLDAAAPHVEVAGVRVLGGDDVEARSDSSVGAETGPDDLAYVLYTSGSTGTPKGVMLSHRNGLAFVDWAVACFGVENTDRLSSHAPLHFDLSVFDLFAAAEAGAAVVLVPPEASVFPRNLAEFIDAEEISIWYSVPSILSLLALRGGLEAGSLPRLRTVLFAGEVFPTRYLRELMALLPHARFSNLFGPTETNVCTYYDVPQLAESDTEAIPIGRPIDGVDVLLLTDDGGIAQAGEVGELCVHGPTVMHGYWGDPDRSERVLVPYPPGEGRGELMYRTGDLVREEGGDLLFLGRRDSQIKSRGYRIELGEVESVLAAHPEIVECAVTAVPDSLLTNTLKAFVVARGEIGSQDVARFCAKRLPKYMIPDAIEFCQALPRTSTGKIDRQSLAKATT